jgi:hypothetical protein
MSSAAGDGDEGVRVVSLTRRAAGVQGWPRVAQVSAPKPRYPMTAGVVGSWLRCSLLLGVRETMIDSSIGASSCEARVTTRRVRELREVKKASVLMARMRTARMLMLCMVSDKIQ